MASEDQTYAKIDNPVIETRLEKHAIVLRPFSFLGFHRFRTIGVLDGEGQTTVNRGDQVNLPIV